MNKEQEREQVKIMTKQGRIITLSITDRTETHFYGTDKYGKSVVIPLSDVNSCYPLRSGDK